MNMHIQTMNSINGLLFTSDANGYYISDVEPKAIQVISD